jgi:purine-nucleoside phosphorylase
MFGYTGTYKGKKVSVMGSGMGVASAGIYSFELMSHFDVDNVIRIGTAGGYNPDLAVGQVLLATEAFSESPFAELNGVKSNNNVLPATEKLIKLAQETAEELNVNVQSGKMHSSDVFYQVETPESFVAKGIDAVEMEAYALYTNAIRLNKNALCICTCSDNIATGAAMSAEERQTKLVDMVTLALEMAIKY